MGIFNNVRSWLKGRSYQPYASGGQAWGNGYGISGLLSGSSYPYQREAGLVYDNSVVGACLSWVTAKIGEATLEVQELRDGKWIAAKDQELAEQFRNPNPYYNDSALLGGAVMSWFVRGNAYIFIERSRLGAPKAFYYLPHFLVRVMSDRDNKEGTKLVTHYLYRPIGGSEVPYEIEQILHLRRGIDPLTPNMGLSPLWSQLRHVCTDNEAATYTAAILRNMGIPGVVMTPKEGWVDATPEQRRTMEERWRDFRRDARGDALALPGAVDLHDVAFDPDKLAMDAVAMTAAARVCAGFGIDPMVIGLPSASKTYSNYEEALKAAVHNCVIPLLTEFGKQITHQVGTLVGLDGTTKRLAFNTSGMQGLQEDQDKLHARWRENFAKGITDRATAQERIGEKPDEAQRGIYAKSPAQNDPNDPNAKEEKP